MASNCLGLNVLKMQDSVSRAHRPLTAGIMRRGRPFVVAHTTPLYIVTTTLSRFQNRS